MPYRCAKIIRLFHKVAWDMPARVPPHGGEEPLAFIRGKRRQETHSELFAVPESTTALTAMLNCGRFAFPSATIGFRQGNSGSFIDTGDA
jgi:hypothetical protein